MPDSPRGGLHAVRADLHAHSNVSDGLLAPADLVERAAAQDVELFALTDHDEIAGLAAARDAALRLGLRFVPGVEVSVTWAGKTVHVVGLGIDGENASLAERLAAVRAGRLRRAQQIGAELAQAGITGAYEGALALAGNPKMVSRTHFARHLVEIGHCRDVRDVFTRYLAEGKPGYVPHQWATLADAVQMIRAAGGTAVVAHPGRYKLGALALHELLTQFRALGGVAIEVATSNHTEREMERFAALAREFGFEASGGSDFHGPGEAENVELGRVARLPGDLVPVWHRYW
jgi:predicted metal-dependent phosphoesterase TrpH